MNISWFGVRLLVAIPVLIGMTSVVYAGPLADYGDAPDGVGGKNYPSLFNSPNAGIGLNAPFHLDTTKEWLGKNGPPSTTTTEADSLQVNNDFDDSGSLIFGYTAAGIGSRGYLFTSVSYDPALSAPAESRFLNAVVDFNGNGRFGDLLPTQAEWIVRNTPIDLSIVPLGINTLNVFAGFSLDPSFLGATDLDLRVTLSTIPVPASLPAQWDGSGPLAGFDRGETEDVIVPLFEELISIESEKAGQVAPMVGKFFPNEHALTPLGGGQVPVGEFRINSPRPDGTVVEVSWTRVCNIDTPGPGGACNELLPSQGPNSVNATLLGVTARPPPPPGPLPACGAPGGGLVLPGVGAPAPGCITSMHGINTLTVTAAFPSQRNGDTHTRLSYLYDPEDTYFLSIDPIERIDFLHPSPVPEPSSLALLGTGVFGFFSYAWRQRKRRA